MVSVVAGGALVTAGGGAPEAAFGRSGPASDPAARFILLGDAGTGEARARQVAAQIARRAAAAPVSHVFLLGDNVYEHGEARAIGRRFLEVFRGVLAAGAGIHAALGNHDVDHCRDSGRRPVPRDGSAYRASPDCWVEAHLGTPEFGYQGELRYYSVEIPAEAATRADGRGPTSAPLVEVFVLDSNSLGEAQNRFGTAADEPQRHWLTAALARSRARWKVVAMHHPLYAPKRCRWLGFGCRGDDEALRSELEPIFRQGGVDAVFQAHQHLYARLKPQGGVRYFVTGAGGKRPDSFRPDPRTVPREDRGAFNHFVHVEATRDRFDFEVIDRDAKVRDRGGWAHRDSGTGDDLGDAWGEGRDAGGGARTAPGQRP